MSRIESWVGGMSTKKTEHLLWLVDCCVVHAQIHRERRRRLKSSANLNPPVSELEKGEIGKRGWRRDGRGNRVSHLMATANIAITQLLHRLLMASDKELI